MFPFKGRVAKTLLRPWQCRVLPAFFLLVRLLHLRQIVSGYRARGASFLRHQNIAEGICCFSIFHPFSTFGRWAFIGRLSRAACSELYRVPLVVCRLYSVRGRVVIKPAMVADYHHYQFPDICIYTPHTNGHESISFSSSSLFQVSAFTN